MMVSLFLNYFYFCVSLSVCYLISGCFTSSFKNVFLCFILFSLGEGQFCSNRNNIVLLLKKYILTHTPYASPNGMGCTLSYLEGVLDWSEIEVCATRVENYVHYVFKVPWHVYCQKGLGKQDAYAGLVCL